MQIDQLYAGGLTPLPPEGHPTGMFKQPIARARVGAEGIEGDRQADRRYHGGPEKALHQYAPAGYAALIEHFPQLAGQAVPGSLGENISVAGLTDANVCIGDIYRLGAITVQVSQPRRPCWKINHRFGIDGLSLFIAQHGITGWYYRVLEPGELRVGDEVHLLERPNPAFDIARFTTLELRQHPDPDELMAAAECRGLSEKPRQRLLERAELLRHGS